MLTIAGIDAAEMKRPSFLMNVKENGCSVIYADNSLVESFPSINELGIPVVRGTFLEVKTNICNALLLNRNDSILYLVSGSPFFYSGATLIINKVKESLPDFDEESEIRIWSSPSNFEKLLLKLRIDARDTIYDTLHAKSSPDPDRFLVARYTFLLCDLETLHHLDETLRYMPEHSVKIYAGIQLTTPSEKIISFYNDEIRHYKDHAKEWMPYSILLEKEFSFSEFYPSDDSFEKERGMITSNEKRALALNRLQCEKGKTLWDMGAGTGSISIQAFLQCKVKTLLFEKNPDRIMQIKKNLARHFVWGAEIIEGDQFQTYINIKDDPDYIFIGGGGASVATNIERLYLRLKAGGRMVLHFVSLNYFTESVTALRNCKIPFHVSTISLGEFRFDSSLSIHEADRMLFSVTIQKEF